MRVDFGKLPRPDYWQRQAIRSLGNTLVDGGPGGGKTFVMGLRGLWLLDNGINPNLLRGINFSVAADEELAKVLPGIEMSTMHALAYRVLCRYRHEEQLAIRDTVSILKEVYPDFTPIELSDLASRLELNKVETPGKPILHEEYEAYKREHHLWDFADLLVEFYNLLKSGVAQEMLGQEHLLVDEFQDICRLMFAILELLSPLSITAIGDPYQSMYSWRGAYDTIFDDFKRVFNATERPLRLIRRHGQGIVDAYERLYRRGLKSVKSGPRGEVQIIRGRGSLGEMELLEKLVQSGDTILARTGRQLQLVLEYAKFSCRYHTSTRSLTDGRIMRVSGKAPYVELRTLNDAKGRNGMNNVFIIGAGSPFMPHINSMNDEEEKHLLYVGMSRAEGNLYILYRDEPSTFLWPLRCYGVDDMKIRRDGG